MALFNCPECNKEISTKATSCPNCGVPVVENIPNVTKSGNEIKIDNKPTKTNILFPVFLCWFLGVIGLMCGLSQIFNKQSAVLGILNLALAVLLLPPIRKFVHSKTNIKINGTVRFITAFILYVFIANLSSMQKEQEEEEMRKIAVEQLKVNKAKRLEIFNKSKGQIITDVKSAMEGKDFEKVVQITSKYYELGDKDISIFHNQASSEIKKIKTEKRISELETKLSSIVTTNDFYLVYKELNQLNPESLEFREKFKEYQIKKNTEELAIKQAEEKKIKEEADKQERTKLIERLFSAWDGSHRNLVNLVKKTMNDPDSFKHDETLYWDKGTYLVVLMKYRGKNGFGGVVRGHIKVNSDLQGNITDILETE